MDKKLNKFLFYAVVRIFFPRNDVTTHCERVKRFALIYKGQLSLKLLQYSQNEASVRNAGEVLVVFLFARARILLQGLA